MEEKEVLVPPPEQLAILHSEPSCKTRRIRAAKAKGIGELSEIIKIQNKEEKKSDNENPLIEPCRVPEPSTIELKTEFLLRAGA